MTDGAPRHGGNLALHVERYGIARDRWLDLSTGINPCAYPLPPMPAAILHALPYPDPAFLQAAAQYYRTGHFLAVPGSQWAIEQLPDCFPAGSVAVPGVGYREHFHQWQRRGHRVVTYDPAALQEALPTLSDSDLRAVVVINPNNPSTVMLTAEVLQEVAQTLATRNVYLIVDEAFIDTQPASSLLARGLPANAIILRSFGKFFGLPGVRLGFVMGPEHILQRLDERLGLWAINATAQYAACAAFRDTAWQHAMRDRLASWSEEFHRRISSSRLGRDSISSGHGALFATFLLARPDAERWFEHCARHGILIRLWEIDQRFAYLRFGLTRCDDHAAIERVEHALAEGG